MKKYPFRRFAYFCMVIFTFSSQSVFAAPESERWDFWNKSNEDNKERIDHSQWQKILETYVHTDNNDLNLFDYAGVTEQDLTLLENYLNALQEVDPGDYSYAEQKAYWINLYNALTVDLILQDYPVESITDLGEGFFSFGPWDDKVAFIDGKDLTLNDIEHRILRPIFQDQRIHFAVNCASIGCPNIQKVAFTAENTEVLMEQAAKSYLTHPRGAKFEGSRLTLSSIFDWYVIDFGNNQTDLLKAISKYMPEESAAKIRHYQGKIKYEYDWNLNEYRN